MIHQVHALPKEGEYVRAKCGRRISDPSQARVYKSDAPEGAEFCRSACWREGLSFRAKVVLLNDLLKSSPGETVPSADIKAILEDRYYPEENRSPKAA